MYLYIVRSSAARFLVRSSLAHRAPSIFSTAASTTILRNLSPTPISLAPWYRSANSKYRHLRTCSASNQIIFQKRYLSILEKIFSSVLSKYYSITAITISTRLYLERKYILYFVPFYSNILFSKIFFSFSIFFSIFLFLYFFFLFSNIECEKRGIGVCLCQF